MNSESDHDPANAQHSGAWIATLTCLLFLLSLWGAWNASRQTEYLPIHDVLSYTEKAKNVWSEIWRGNFRGLHGVEQTIRPFGTSLLGYPLGYNEDFRAYYWRTVAFPACFCALGAFLVALAAGASRKDPAALLLACLGGMLPMWWCFDPAAFGDTIVKKISIWGMMDGMQAGVAALAAGLLVYAWRRNVWSVTFVSFFLSAFTLLLKPVGVFLIAGHALAGAGFLIWTYFREPSRNCGRFAWGLVLGIGWGMLICGWCYFSPYFSATNQELGRQALDQLKTMSINGIIAQLFVLIMPSLCIYALGLATLCLWGAILIHFQKTSLKLSWVPVLVVIGGVLLFFQLTALYYGTGFKTARYFLPALAIFWIFVSPLVWLFLKTSFWARLLVLANGLILAASVWFPDFSKAIHQATGYATFLNQKASATASIAYASVQKMPHFDREPIIYILLKNIFVSLTTHQLATAGRWKEEVCWKYGPRIWEKHTPTIHPHEIATADFLLISSKENSPLEQKFTAIHEAMKVMRSSEGLSQAPVLEENNDVSVRRIADPNNLEKLLCEHLARLGILHPNESGPVLEKVSAEEPLATFDSGDELLAARAEWVGQKLRVIATWSGSRDLKRHLQASLSLVDANNIPIHWIPLSILAPPTAGDGLRYRRTIVDELDCSHFRNKTAGVALGIYDLSRKSMVRPVSSTNKVVADRILQAIGTNEQTQESQSP